MTESTSTERPPEPRSPEPALAEKRIVVTGSSQGIGRAIALRVAREGARVLVTASGTGPGGRGGAERTLAALVEEIEAADGEAQVFVGSVAEDDLALEMIETAVTRWGGVDGLVNCAGVPEPVGSSMLDITAAEWERVRSVHLEGTFHSCRHAIPHLIAAGGGSIVNTSSHAFTGIYGGTAYGAAKGAINSLTRELAADLAEARVRCNAVCPGARTRLSTGPEYEAQIARLEARGLLNATQAKASIAAPLPAGCASLYAYLLSDASAAISGEIFSASGGYIGLFERPRENLLLMKRDTTPWRLDELETRIPEEIARLER